MQRLEVSGAVRPIYWSLCVKRLRAILALRPPISPLTSSGQRNRASWASQPQKSVTLLPCPGREDHEVHKDMWGNRKKKKLFKKLVLRKIVTI